MFKTRDRGHRLYQGVTPQVIDPAQNASNNNAYAMIRTEVNHFKSNFPIITHQAASVPQEVLMGNAQNTVVTNTSNTQDTKLIEKNGRLISCLSVFSPVPNTIVMGTLLHFFPPNSRMKHSKCFRLRSQRRTKQAS